MMKPPFSKKFQGLFKVAMMGSLAVSCSLDPSLPNKRNIEQTNQQSLPLIGKSVAAESNKYAEEQDELTRRVEKINPAAELMPMEPSFDPLEAITVSVDVDNEDAQNIFYVIADQAKMNVILAPELAEMKQRITLHLKDLPANQVFYQVLRMLDMDGEIKDNVMMVRPLKEQVFDLEFLQTMTSVDFRAGGDVFGSGMSSSGSGGGGAGGGGVGGGGGGGMGGGGSSGGGGGSSNNGMQSAFNLKGKNISEDDPYKEIEEMFKTITGGDNLKVETGSEKTASSEITDSGTGQNKIADKISANPVYVLNKSTGTLFVRARPSQMTVISQLVEHYKEVQERQVIIEAQIIDIQLNDDFQLGVDWTLLKNRLAASSGSGVGLDLSSGNTTFPGSSFDGGRTLTIPAAAIGGPIGLGAAYIAGPVAAAVDIMKTFGTIKVLSNPSIRVKNSQPAIVSVGRTERYISQTMSNVSNAGGGQSTVSSNVITGNIFDGIVLGVIPFVTNHKTINLTINPMQTKVLPGSTTPINVGGSENPILVSLPKTDFKGLTTSLSIGDGDVVILGGLISESYGDSGHGIPLLSDIPYLGALFGGRGHTAHAREFVLILRVRQI
ncbi:MAG: pilus (MSHA type) biogenesis protein MshL [Methylobacter sp.]|uniref:Pilus (MSHA type) biogenesis protein MshL n=1 Tax=Candidatus Methylobacter titanis TaxID=3053457 RepID=A0AA43Q0Y8_9GAMM|nr:pilus (MSHA type) biogenesis protein MshL [Candidatus Methylobacter titanis]